MAFELRQNLKLTQQLIMTPQLQQSIKLLQLSRLELVSAINQELLENPMLEEETLDAETAVDHVPDIGEDDGRPAETSKEITGEGDGKDDFDWDGYFEDYGVVGVNFSQEIAEAPSLENMSSKEETLVDYLLWQFNLSRMTEEEKERAVAGQIIGNLNANGYLAATLEEIAAATGEDTGFVETVLFRVQEFDPPGIAARDLRECLLIQLRHMESPDPLAGTIIEEHLDDLQTNNYDKIAKQQKVSVEDVMASSSLILGLDPKPGLRYNRERCDYIIPDVYVYKEGDEFRISLNEDGLPRLRVSALYRKMLALEASSANEAKNREYIRERLQSALWLIKSIQQRQKTIYRVSESIVKHQIDFFERGIDYLKPMVLRDIAEDVEMHESTISRVTSSKYMHTPRGIFELKYFFSSGIQRTEGNAIASESVKDRIAKLVAGEDLRRPYNDSQIVELLKKDGIRIARRTVAKYRGVLNILPSHKRKKYY
ncbi:MAG: RNA polymerase factor sigma-54 [Syntrophales bacterium]|jgi:RNA polymerase sigma-54 factor|nr:RNA polymerase factor sigma-54 [Syntrophales bacterium]MCK9527447.1 RNA polymerase factor sigma-54 [Syntrophales bacterium]MDX9921551.1 RNA polymerase factor sigma-54 [Syntrophales bacterium]